MQRLPEQQHVTALFIVITTAILPLFRRIFLVDADDFLQN